MTLIFGQDEIVSGWVATQLDMNPEELSPCKAIGVVEGERLIAGFVYNNYHEKKDGSGLYIELSVASIDKRWMTRHTIYTMFAYPFVQLKLERLQALTAASNEGVNSIMSRLGFKKEGFHRKAYHDGTDAVSWAMLKDECRWIK